VKAGVNNFFASNQDCRQIDNDAGGAVFDEKPFSVS